MAERLEDIEENDVTEPELNDEESALSGILAELDADSDAYISIYRSEQNRPKGAYLFRCSPSDFNLPDILDKLRDEYGGGDYRIVIYVDGKIHKSRPISVAAPLKKEEIKNPFGDNNLLLQIQENNRQQSEMMREFMHESSRRQSDMMIELLKSMNENNNNKQGSMAEMVQTIVALNELNKKPENIGPEKLLEMFFKGMDQGKELGDNGDDNVLQTMIKTFGPSITGMAEKLQQIEQGRPKSSPVRQLQKVPAPHHPENREEKVTEESQTYQDDNAILMQTIPVIQRMLFTAAHQDADPEVYANLVLDQIPTETVITIVSDETQYYQLFGGFNNEETARYKPWFDKLREITLELLQDDSPNTDVEPTHDTSISSETVPEPSSSDNAV